MKKISLLGSTGSIGTQTLEVVRSAEQKIKIYALTANTLVDLLEEQTREFRPELVVMMDEKAARELRIRVKDLPVKVLAGLDGMVAAAAYEPIDMVVTAVSGSIGLEPTLAALEAGKNIALANKETLVAAGELVMNLAAQNGCSIIPVDSEHSAIFQCLESKNRELGVRNRESKFKIILTASGGPFRGWKKEQLATVTPAMALKHPNWNMGSKITIDSATMMNKGLEVIEAHFLFGAEYNEIEVLVHPQSIVHSMVEYQDGSIIAQLGMPDMRLPIQYALSYPDRWDTSFNEFSLAGKALSFEKPDLETFPALRLAYECGQLGGTLPAVMNAANEICVHAFLHSRIKYHEILEITERTCRDHKSEKADNLKTILAADAWAREYAEEIISRKK
ncbi:MAG: 1-deoxy-D-xylulose-5-phosphate reductoisomerase [Peptococcaceae bacterium]|nr:1-deoxy-D-xylulose-5-phosphate reductoisomerase [Peptococcaceae bacterium]